MKLTTVLFLAIISFSYINIYSQPYNPYEGIGGFNCQNPTFVSRDKNTETFGGLRKPERTNQYQNTTNQSVFRILIVFVQFNNDYTYDWCTYWPPQSKPDYINTLLASERNNNYGEEWWNAYSESDETISDYYMEVSRGNFHVVGQCVNVILPRDSAYYQKKGLEQLNSDLYADLIDKVDWKKFDNWSYNNNTFGYQGDKNIDMMYVVHRIWRDGLFDGMTGSIAQLYNSKQGQSHNLGNGYFIKAGNYVDGSGATFTTGQGAKVPHAPFTKYGFLTVQAHELGHYLFGGGHQSYGLMMGGWIKSLIATGADSRLSPWETIYMGYGAPVLVDFYSKPYQENYHLNDFSSRNDKSSLEVLQVPIDENNPDEFFLIANRSKVSSYDRIMWGDTAKNDCFRKINPEYGKGVYIYHKLQGYKWSESEPYRYIDLECADGLFDWEFGGFFTPDWSENQQLAFIRKIGVSRMNDHSFGSIYGADDKSVELFYQDQYWNCWGGIGKKHTCLYSLSDNDCNESTDRVYTNLEEIWTSRAWEGDRWDAWRKGYNEVFSPYSSPSTYKWNVAEGNIFIWLYNEDANGVDFKIYKTGCGGYDLNRILKETPPSRPMGLTISYTDCIDGVRHPVLTWNHNLEPDMDDKINHPEVKRYRVGRAFTDVNSVPGNFGGCADQYFNISSDPRFIDFATTINCDGSENPLAVRYSVKAVDKEQWESVPSDFVVTYANGVSLPDKGNSKKIIAKEFKLFQNYPNPFNPVTNIKYDLPKDVFVSVKIYDLIGKEIKTLVNEFKNAGSYIVSFNGAELASGIYFYRIQTGNFVQVKRMLLIK